MTTPYRVAKSLLTLRAQLDQTYPERSTASDGFIGDKAHQQRQSDHNPWVIDTRLHIGVVTAGDFTHDPHHGLDCNNLVAGIVQSRDHRVKYIIWNGRMWRSYDKKIGTTVIRAWAPAEYTGESRHDKHAHVSVNPDPADYDETGPWRILPVAPHPAPAGHYGTYQHNVRPGRRVLQLWSAGDDVAYVQRWLGIPDDGYFGPQTEKRVQWYQGMRHLKVDGIVGPATWRDLT